MRLKEIKDTILHIDTLLESFRLELEMCDPKNANEVRMLKEHFRIIGEEVTQASLRRDDPHKVHTLSVTNRLTKFKTNHR